MKHIMKLKPTPFSLIENGTKTIELRLYDEKRRRIHIGDIIEFIHTENSDKVVEAKVMDLYLFDSFETLFDKLPLLDCGYTEDNIGDASPDDMNQYYSKERQMQYGVVGIKIEVL